MVRAQASVRPQVTVRSTSGGALASRGGSPRMTRRDFFAAVIEGMRRDLPSELAAFRHRANPMLLKVDYGNERIHYEVMADGERERLEIGLHFEDGPASTAAYLAFFDARIVEIKHLLGPQIELERWTLSWGHLFESVPLAPLDRRFAASVGGCLARQIAVLQPLVVEAAVAPGRHDPSTHRPRWRRGH